MDARFPVRSIHWERKREGEGGWGGMGGESAADAPVSRSGGLRSLPGGLGQRMIPYTLIQQQYGTGPPPLTWRDGSAVCPPGRRPGRRPGGGWRRGYGGLRGGGACPMRQMHGGWMPRSLMPWMNLCGASPPRSARAALPVHVCAACSAQGPPLAAPSCSSAARRARPCRPQCAAACPPRTARAVLPAWAAAIRCGVSVELLPG